MEKNMTVGNPAKLIFMFTLPLIAGNIVQQFYIVVDTLIVGRTLGINALAAVGSTGSLMFLMIGFLIGLTSGFSIVTGQRFGANDIKGVKNSVVTCIILTVLCSIVLTLSGVLSAKFLLEIMQTPPEIIEDAYNFLVIIYGGIGATMLFNMMANLIRAIGDSKSPLWFLIFGSFLNIGLELLFIIVFKMGIPGAALATVLAQILAGGLCFLYILKKLPILRITKSDWQIDYKSIMQHLRIGFPMAFQAILIALGAIIVQVALNGLGSEAIAAFAAAQKIDMIAIMPMMSFGMAMATYTALNYGAQNILRIKQGVNQCILMSGLFSLGIGIINIFYGGYMASFFVGPGETKVISLAQTYLHISGLFYWILALLFIYRYTLQGLGKSLVPTIAGIMELFMRIFAAVYMANYFGFTGVCSASPLAWIGSAVPLIIAYYYTMKYQFKT